MSKKLTFGLLAAALAVGVLGGYVLGQTKAKTVTKTVEVEKRVEVTPQVCLDALDLASEGFGYAAEFGDATAETYEAIIALDATAIDAATAKVEVLTDKVNALTPQMASATVACRAAA